MSISKEINDALIHHQAGRLKQAEDIYLKILAKEPEHPAALHLLGVVNSQKGQPEKAIELIEKAIKNDPNVADFYSNCGLAYSALNKYEDAIEYYEKALSINQNFAQAAYNMGVSLVQLNKFDEAINYYKKALAIDPSHVDASNNIANTYLRQDKPDEAIKYYKNALDSRPDNLETLNNLATTLMTLNRTDEALTCYKKALNINPEHIEANRNYVRTLINLNKQDEAVKHYENILEKNPDNVDILIELSKTFIIQEKYDKAITLLNKALSIKPEISDIHYHIANALFHSGQKYNALPFYKKAISLDPINVEAYNYYGIALNDISYREEALKIFKQALDIDPHNIKVLTDLGNAYSDLNLVNKGLECYKKALKLDKRSYMIHNNIGNALSSMNKNDEALKHYNKALELGNHDAGIYRNVVSVDPDIKHAPIIKNILDTKDISDQNKMEYHFALGELYDKNKQFPDAFRHFEIANSIKRNKITYDSDAYTRQIDKVIELFSKDFFKNRNVGNSGTKLPVFIVGMPRSGTTLIEQILSSHPDVFGAGELDLIKHIRNLITKSFNGKQSYPYCVSLLNDQDINNYSDMYLHQIKKYSSEAKRITDKMPGNVNFIGIIKLLFPNAHIINCQRDARDNCLSIYLNYFPGGNDYTFNLEDIAKYYIDYVRLMEHWNNTFPGEILNIQYEELLDNQETLTRSMLEFIDMEWNEACVNFQENKRSVRTASKLQIRKGIYKTSKNRWKNYEEYISPLLKLLEKY